MIKITIISGVIELKDDFSEDQLLKEIVNQLKIKNIKLKKNIGLRLKSNC